MTQAIVKRMTLDCDCCQGRKHQEGMVYYDPVGKMLMVIRRGKDGNTHFIAFTRQRIDNLFDGKNDSPQIS